MNKRQKKKFMNRRYEIVDSNREDLINHHFKIGTIIKATGVTDIDSRSRRLYKYEDSSELSQWVCRQNLKRSYKKFR